MAAGQSSVSRREFMMGAALGMAAVVLPAPVRDYLERQHMPLPTSSGMAPDTYTTFEGKWFSLPSVRIWPTPIRRPEEVLLHAINSAESMDSSIRRGLPGLMARPFNPFREQVDEFARYRTALEEAGRDPQPFLDRATVLKYAFVAPTKKDAHALAREAMEWDFEILQRLTTPTTTAMPKGYELYEQRHGMLPDFQYDEWAEHVLLFDDPDGCAEKIGILADAGVRRRTHVRPACRQARRAPRALRSTPSNAERGVQRPVCPARMSAGPR